MVIFFLYDTDIFFLIKHGCSVNTVFTLHPSNRVIKRIWCIFHNNTFNCVCPFFCGKPDTNTILGVGEWLHCQGMQHKVIAVWIYLVYVSFIFFFFFCMGDFFFLLLVCFPGLQGPSESVLLLHKTQIKSDIR